MPFQAMTLGDAGVAFQDFEVGENYVDGAASSRYRLRPPGRGHFYCLVLSPTASSHMTDRPTDRRRRWLTTFVVDAARHIHLSISNARALLGKTRPMTCDFEWSSPLSEMTQNYRSSPWLSPKFVGGKRILQVFKGKEKKTYCLFPT